MTLFFIFGWYIQKGTFSCSFVKADAWPQCPCSYFSEPWSDVKIIIDFLKDHFVLLSQIISNKIINIIHWVFISIKSIYSFMIIIWIKINISSIWLEFFVIWVFEMWQMWRIKNTIRKKFFLLLVEIYLFAKFLIAKSFSILPPLKLSSISILISLKMLSFIFQ